MANEVAGLVCHGVHCGNVGVYTSKDGSIYGGAHAGGKAHGFGVYKGSQGVTASGQRANGLFHGHVEYHYADGDIDYYLFEHRNIVRYARVELNGACVYDDEPCWPHHAGHVALKAAAQQAGVRNSLPHPPHPRPQRPCRWLSHAFDFGAGRRLAALGVRALVRACVPVRASPGSLRLPELQLGIFVARFAQLELTAAQRTHPPI